jgi:hypothetical protein
MSREQLLELEDMKRGLLVQAYRMKQECPHMSPVGLEHEMYVAIKRYYSQNTKVCRSIAEQKSKYCMNDTKEGSVNGMRYVG